MRQNAMRQLWSKHSFGITILERQDFPQQLRQRARYPAFSADHSPAYPAWLLSTHMRTQLTCSIVQGGTCGKVPS